ncbi:MAG TPA: phage holin family protein [Burkholderiales bacterium]|nr:phage holin family protein [Burkholderiales bacterium]
MEPTNTLNRAGEPIVAGGIVPPDSGLLEDLKLLWHELLGLVHDQLTLAALETRSAGNSLVTMIAAGVMVAALLVSAWLGLMGAAVLWLINMGVIASVAMLVAVIANLALALILYDVIRRQSRHLQFPATLRALRPVPTTRLNSPEDREGSGHANTT